MVNSKLQSRFGKPMNVTDSPYTSCGTNYSKGSITSQKWLKPADLMRYVGGVSGGKPGVGWQAWKK